MADPKAENALREALATLEDLESRWDAARDYLKIDAGQTSRDGVFSLEVVACIGACGLAPVICVNGEFHAGVSTKSVAKILDSYRRKAAHNDGEAA